MAGQNKRRAPRGEGVIALKIIQLSAEGKYLPALNALKFAGQSTNSVKDFLEESLASYRKYNDVSEGSQVNGHQGVCQFIDQLLGIIDNASNTLQNIETIDQNRSMASEGSSLTEHLDSLDNDGVGLSDMEYG